MSKLDPARVDAHWQVSGATPGQVEPALCTQRQDNEASDGGYVRGPEPLCATGWTSRH